MKDIQAGKDRDKAAVADDAARRCRSAPTSGAAT